MRRRISELGHSPAKNLRALFFRNSWLSLRPNCMSCPFFWFPLLKLVNFWETENEMADDVALDFGCASLDGVSASSQIGVRPKSIVDGVGIACHELAERTENFLGDLLEALVELAPENFLDGAFRAGNAGCTDAAEGAHLIEAHDFDFGAALRELLPDDWVFGGGAAIALGGAREFDETRDVTFENQMQARAVRAALVHERAHCDIPAVIHFAEDIFSGHADIPKKKLVEFGFAGHLAERTNFDAG